MISNMRPDLSNGGLMTYSFSDFGTGRSKNGYRRIVYTNKITKIGA